ncbi:MAG TPA: bifunctional 2-polyprenyl-6-hydroxyphenol methylase/3-demethylubiquinol 3-O-methyltransferase UbiG [Blastocatellia bacterium]|nr:bifunctional 2-polyprenyl-6-hydroxyphenol methylase/3-demethylubiquinol 3-O-methyltransferase UbiG [Blastocatellia bacterium]
MKIDNQWYERLGDGWWDSGGPVGLLHEINPARFEYFKQALGTLRGLRLLDVGCGGGLLAERFAREGALVTGVDLSPSSLVAASRHGETRGLAIDYVNASGDLLPFRDSSFDAVVSADFLEHVTGLEAVIAECARVLKPSGLFLYDTINRTLRSRVVAVWLFERVLRLIPRHTHDPLMFIKPDELHRAMARNGISNCETRGLSPARGPVAALAGLAMNRRAGSYKITEDTAISYVGYGVKAG